MFQLLHSSIEVNKIVCSDINKSLIDLWKLIKLKPDIVAESYRERWEELYSFESIDDKKKYYYSIRELYNKTEHPLLLLFLSRTCANGLIRYNSKGEFNSPFNFTRPGINPDSLTKIINDWSYYLNINNVNFICQSYENIITSKDDFIYLDPPYINTSSMYYGKLNYDIFFSWLRKQKSKYILSFDGKTTEQDMTYNVPDDLFDKHIYAKSAISGFQKLHKKSVYGKESLYLKY